MKQLLYILVIIGTWGSTTSSQAATIHTYNTVAGTPQTVATPLTGTGDIVIQGDGQITFSGTSSVYLLDTSLQIRGKWELNTSWNNLDSGNITFTHDGATIHGGQRSSDNAYSVIRMRGNIIANENSSIDAADIRFYKDTTPSIEVAEGKTLTMNRGIFNNDGAITLTKTGQGTLLLTGIEANFLGSLVIAQGTIAIDASDQNNDPNTALGNCNNSITIQNGGTLALLKYRALGKHYGDITLESGGILNVQANASIMTAIGKTLQLEGTATIQNLPGTTWNQFQLRNGTTKGILVNVPGANANATITVSNLLLAREMDGELNDTTWTVVFNVEESSGKLLISSTISGENNVNSIRKTGDGTLVFSGAFANSMDGTTTIEAGKILLSGASIQKLTPTVTILPNATLEFVDGHHHQLFHGTTLNIGGTWTLHTSWNEMIKALNFTHDNTLISGGLRESDKHYATLRIQQGITAAGNTLIDGTSLRFYFAADDSGYSNQHELFVVEGKTLSITETLQKQSGNAADISLTKTGKGTLELVNRPILATGVMTFDGKLLLEEGTILASNIYSGTLSIGADGTFSPGTYTAGESMQETTGTFTVSNLENAGKIVFDIDHMNDDTLNITGTFNDLGGMYLMNFLNDPEIAFTQTYALFSSAEVGELAWELRGLDTNIYRAYMTDGNLTVENMAAVPEPTSGTLLLLILVGWLGITQRKKLTGLL